MTITKAHVAVLEPALPLLGRVLSYTRKTFVADGEFGWRESVEEVTSCEIDLKGRVCFPVGMLPRVMRLLREHGYRVRVKDRRKPGPRLRVDDEALAGGEGRDRHLLRVLAHQRLGQVEVSTDQDALKKMLLVHRLFPDARVVVAVPTREQAMKVRGDLADSLDAGATLAVSGVKPAKTKWLVGTFQSVPRDRAKKCDILLLPFAEESTGEKACAMIAEMRFERRYAFIRPQRRPDALVQHRLEQIAGEVRQERGINRPVPWVG